MARVAAPAAQPARAGLLQEGGWMRARNIKPGFFKNEILAAMPPIERLLFIGLWTLADREGRLEDRPMRIKGELFPYESFDVNSSLKNLESSGFLLRYEVDGEPFIQVNNFVKHQDPHYKEKASVIPPPPGGSNLIMAIGLSRGRRAAILERDNYTCQACGATSNLCVDHILPVSRGGDSSNENLQCLCMSCNTKKSNRINGEEAGPRRSKYDQTSTLTRIDVNPTSTRRQPDASASVPLIPDSLIPDSLIPDSLIPDSPIQPLPLPASPPGAPSPKGTKKRSRADKISGYLPEVVAMVTRLGNQWPTMRGGKPIPNDDVAACARVEEILAQHPDVKIEELERAGESYLRTNPEYPNAIQFWFGPGKSGTTPPWLVEIKKLRTRQEMSA